MIARFNDQEERLLGLENHSVNSRNMIERYENSFMGFHNEVIKLNEMVKLNEKTVPSWRREIEASLGKVNLVLSKVENRMEEFMVWINHIKESNRNEEIPADVVNSLQELIQDTSAVSSVEDLRLQVEEISQEVLDERSRTNLLRSMAFNLQDKLEEFPRQTSASSLAGSREDISHQDSNAQDGSSIESESINLERDIVRK